jgi:isoamylase
MTQASPAGRYEVLPGVPYPLGATFDGQGVNFAVFSKEATSIELCLFDAQGLEHRLPLRDVTNQVWHGYVPGLPVGSLYGFRADGPWAPHEGLCFNSHKLLIDPHARAVTGKLDPRGPLRNFRGEERDTRDSAASMPRGVVIADAFDWGDDHSPQVLWRRTVIYEAHVKGMTALHPKVPPSLRGTYLGLAHPAVIDHLVSLGVTSIELLPVQELAPEGFLIEKGLTNYWGYNTLGFFAPDQRFATGSRGEQVTQFKQMVKAFHAAGLEVILDVALNHTAEGSQMGPTLSLKGLDNRTYYWLEADDRAKYRDFTGCGNSLNFGKPAVLKFAVDSLRHWVNEFHVDGFRFDLATEMARVGGGAFSQQAAFFLAVHQDPVLSRVKMIAEPWDLGDGGYRLGNFPHLFGEWNDRYRDTMRRFWRGDEWQAPELGYRVAGSADLFKGSGRRPMASINFVTCHDGFTLRDLVSYDKKHNEANGEDNRDGNDDNKSWNCGVEGETADPEINRLRARQQRNFLATLMLSVGTPMLNAGDELGRTQRGSNNGYCQDNQVSWLDWNLDEQQQSLLEFTRELIQFRHRQPVLQRRNFFLGSALDDSRSHDLAWFRPDGNEMVAADWQQAHTRALGWFLGGDAIGTRTPGGERLVGDSLLIYMNASKEDVDLVLPGPAWGGAWEVAIHTALPGNRQAVQARGLLVLPSRSVVVLRQTKG